MKIVGITGNIGSGKTTACRVFEILGIPVFHADIQGRKILTDPHIKEKIVNEFGSEMLNTDDEIDRKILARIVFENPDNLSKLNRIIHPEVHKQFQKWLEIKQDFHYVLYEAAILFESGHAKAMDHIISVAAPESIRISRVMNLQNLRDHQMLVIVNYCEVRFFNFSGFIPLLPASFVNIFGANRIPFHHAFDANRFRCGNGNYAIHSFRMPAFKKNGSFVKHVRKILFCHKPLLKLLMYFRMNNAV